VENPFTHQGAMGTDYVTSEAEHAGQAVQNTAAVPTHLAAILVLAGFGLWGLKRAGFRFVATAGAKGGFS
jgi:flagellar biogenesis protein FliO